MPLINPLILIRSSGEMASAIAHRLYMANVRRICMVDLPAPTCVRRTVAFSPALQEGSAAVEGLEGVAATNREEVAEAWTNGRIAIMAVENWDASRLVPDIVVDAILAKRNIASSIADAPLVIGLGPGFEAGRDCHWVIETNRGHRLGRLIAAGSADANTSVPGEIGGFGIERLLRAPADGIFSSPRRIGDLVRQGEVVGEVDGIPVTSQIDGMLRGLIRPGTTVRQRLKLGDVDPRGAQADYLTISDKARAIAGSVLEAVMRHCNR